MNSGATAERIFDAVKRRIVSGAYRPGERIEVAALAQALDSSTTPVRDALHLLVGERLVGTRAGDGFHVPALDVPSLEDLYRWNAEVLVQALRAWKESRASSASAPDGPVSDPGELVGALFAQIGDRTGNAEYRHAIRSINDRLHSARIAESTLIPDWREEIGVLKNKIEQESPVALRRLIVVYHRRRARIVTDIVRALYQLADRS